MSLSKTIRNVLESWQQLTPEQQGPGYAESVSRLSAWAVELEANDRKELKL